MTCDVVIPCFNAAAFLRTTIESALAQTVPPTRVIVVDDGSTDRSYEIAAAYGPAVTVVRQTNAGECAARNRGLEAGTSDWVAFLDADDVWLPTKLERQLDAAARNPRAVCIHGDYYTFDTDGRRERPHYDLPPDGPYPVERLLIDPLVHPSTAMVRRGVTERFPVGVRQGGDMLFFAGLSLSPDTHFAYVPDLLMGYRLHAQQVTRDRDSWSTHLRNRFRWVADNGDRLGSPRCDALRRGLRRQVVEWIDLARWTRQWERYHSLREFARTLDWPEGAPDVLRERLLPLACYAVKDWIDARIGVGRASRRTTTEG